MNWLQIFNRRTPHRSITSSADTLLAQLGARALLDDLRRNLLGGIGDITRQNALPDYDLVLILSWSGPVSAPKPPGRRDNRFIFVGVENKKVYVNNKQITALTREALQEALLEAAQNEGKLIHRRKC